MPTELQPLQTLLTTAQTIAYIAGGSIFVLCVTLAAIGMMTAGTNVNRQAMIRMWLFLAVGGLIILMLGPAIGLFIQNTVNSGAGVFPTATPHP